MKNSNSIKATKLAFDKGYRIKNGVFTYKGKMVNGSVKIFHGIPYKCFSVRLDGKVRNVNFHRLVGFQKYGEVIFDERIYVRHLDSDSLNNHEKNIGIGNACDNQQDRSLDLRVKSAINASSFIKKHDHEKIIEMHNAGRSYEKIMAELGIKSKGTISFIIRKSMAAKAA